MANNKPGPKKGAKVAKQGGSTSTTKRRHKQGGGHGPIETVMVIGFADRKDQEEPATGPFRGRVTWMTRPRDNKS